MSATEVSVSTDETSPILRTLTVEVDSKRVRKAFDRAYRDLAKQVRVKGFRPGKTPRTVLERMYGKGLAEELQQTLVNESLMEAVEQSGVEPVSEPQIAAEPPAPEQNYRYTAAIEVKPPIELPELTGLAATRPAVVVGDDDIDREIETLREQRAPFVDVAADAAAETGHHVTIDYAGRIDGELFEGGSADSATLELGSGRFIPGFEDQLIGSKVGADVTVEVSFPADYPAEDIAGKDAVFAVHVKGVQQREVPTLDDAFVKGMGDEEVETVDALRAQIRQTQEKQRQQSADQEARRTLIDSLIARCPFDVPPGMVTRRLQQRLETAHQQMAQFMPHEELHQQMSRWQEEWRPDAERDVRETLLLEAVATARAFEASAEEIDAKIADQAAEQGMDVARLRSMYEERGLFVGLEAQICEDKALEYLLAEAKVEETTGT